MKFTKIRQGGREYSIAFPNEEATLFGGVVPNATITSAGVTAVSTDAVVWNVATGQFLLRRGLTFYDAWAASADGTVDDAAAWNARLVAGRRFYVDNGDGTMLWYYCDGVSLLESKSGENGGGIELGSGLVEGSNGKVGVNLGAGLSIGARNQVFVNVGYGLTTENGPLTLRLDTGGLFIEPESGVLGVKIGTVYHLDSGLEGFGLKVDTAAEDDSKGSLKLNLGSGLRFTSDDKKAEVSLGSGLAFSGSDGSVNVNITSDGGLETVTSGGNSILKMQDEFLALPDKVSTLETDAMRTIIEVAGVDYTATTAPTSSTGTTGLPLYWLARPAVFAVKSGNNYYTMPSTDERFAACGLRRVGQLFKCGGETFYLDADLNPVFVNSSVRFDRSGTSVKVYPSNSTLRSLYEAAGAVWNEDTGYYELNGVKDIDEEEMKNIFVKSNNVRLGGNAYHKYAYRTIITPIGSSQSENLISMFAQSSIINVPSPGSNLFAETPALYGFAGSAKNLRIIGNKAFSSVKAFGTAPFSMSRELVHLLIKMSTTNQSIPMPDCVRISYYTLKYLAENWTPTTEVTVTLPTPQATIINTILSAEAGEVADLLPEEQNLIFQQLAQMPWEAKLKISYTQPIWKEDNGSTIAFTNRMPQLDEAGDTYTFQDVTYNDVRPSLIKHEKGANGEYIYGSWYGYVNKMLATDQTKVGSELTQYTTALNTNFAVSIYDWIDLANKFGAKNITIADGGAAAASAEEE